MQWSTLPNEATNREVQHKQRFTKTHCPVFSAAPPPKGLHLEAKTVPRYDSLLVTLRVTVTRIHFRPWIGRDSPSRKSGGHSQQRQAELRCKFT